MAEYHDNSSFRYDDPYAAEQSADEDYTKASLPASPTRSAKSTGSNTSRSARKPRPVVAPVAKPPSEDDSETGSETDSESDDDRTLEKALWDDEEAVGATSIPKPGKKEWVMRALSKGKGTSYAPVSDPRGGGSVVSSASRISKASDVSGGSRRSNYGATGAAAAPKPKRSSTSASKKSTRSSKAPPPPPKPSRSRMGWCIGGAVLAIVLIIAVTFYVVLHNKSSDATVAGTSGNDTSPSNSSSAGSSSASDLSNSDYGTLGSTTLDSSTGIYSSGGSSTTSDSSASSTSSSALSTSTPSSISTSSSSVSASSLSLSSFSGSTDLLSSASTSGSSDISSSTSSASGSSLSSSSSGSASASSWSSPASSTSSGAVSSNQSGWASPIAGTSPSFSFGGSQTSTSASSGTSQAWWSQATTASTYSGGLPLGMESLVGQSSSASSGRNRPSATQGWGSQPTGTSGGDGDMPWAHGPKSDHSEYSLQTAPGLALPPTSFSNPTTSGTSSLPLATPASSSSSQGTLESWKTQRGVGTWFMASEHFTVCGVAPLDSDFVVAISPTLYESSETGDGISQYCGKQITVTNVNNGQSVNVWVTDECAHCSTNSSLDLSRVAFEALSGSSGFLAGVVSIAWGFTPTSASTGSSASTSTSSALWGETQGSSQPSQTSPNGWEESTAGVSPSLFSAPSPSATTWGGSDTADSASASASSSAVNMTFTGDKTSLTSSKSKTYNGIATFYTQGGGQGDCGWYRGDWDSTYYGALSQDSWMETLQYCGECITITNLYNQKSIIVQVADSCPGCDQGHVDLEEGAFYALGGTYDEGQFDISWSFGATCPSDYPTYSG